MAINPETQYPGKIAPSSPDYPYGAARNITNPGDGTGTPWEAALVNDLFGFQQALLSDGEVVPSGTPEKATASQYLEALKKILASQSAKDFDTVAEMTAAAPRVGDVVRIKERESSLWDVVAGGSPDGFGVLDAGGGNTAVVRIIGFADVGFFGAVGDGVADDTAAWEACRDFCLTSPTTLTFAASDGQHYLPNGIDLYGLLYTQIAGNITADNETDEVIIGSNVVAANPSGYFFRNGNCTLKVEGMSRGHVEFLRFERLTLFATNQTGVTETKYNVSYSNFYFTEVDQFRMETNTISGTTAWMNENKFFGARIRESLTMTGDYPMNNNAFYGFKMEGITITIDAYDGNLGAHSNTWHDTRFEFAMTFNFGVGTFNNVFINTWGNFSFVGFLGRDAGTWTINDLGQNNDIVTMQHTYTDGRTLLELTAESRNHDWAHFERVGYKLENRKTFTQFFDTGLVPLDDPIWFVIETDNSIFNYFVEIFDPDGNRIYSDLNVVEAGMTWNASFNYYDFGGAVVGSCEISIKKTTGVGFFRLYGRTAGGTLNELIEYWRLRSIQKKKGGRELRLLPFKGGTETLHGIGVPTYGTFKAGDIIENQAPSVGSPTEWRCVQSGTFSAATDNAGSTDGTTAVITGMTDTSDFNPGDYVTVSAGFSAGDIQIISVDSANQITVNRVSNSAQAGVTVATVDPVFGATPNLV